MEANIRSALGGNTTAISSLRCVKLYFERLGLELQVRQQLYSATTQLGALEVCTMQSCFTLQVSF